MAKRSRKARKAGSASKSGSARPQPSAQSGLTSAVKSGSQTAAPKSVKKTVKKTAQQAAGPKSVSGQAAADAVPRRIMAGADRFLTLLGFIVLVGFSIWLVPTLSQRRGQAFETAVAETQKLLGQTDAGPLYKSLDAGVKSSRSETEVRRWLESLGVLGLSDSKVLARQDVTGMGSAVLSFKARDGAAGVMTLKLLQTRSLDLRSPWHLVDICRPDREARKLLQQFQTHLQSGAPVKAQALIDSAGDSDQMGVLLARAKTLLAKSPSWQNLDASRYPWVLSGKGPGGAVYAEILEQPDRCEYRIADIRAWP